MKGTYQETSYNIYEFDQMLYTDKSLQSAAESAVVIKDSHNMPVMPL